ncbi:MAG TPA: phosphoribosyltransferase family protein, partial [Burkholderiaceae bacterium]
TVALADYAPPIDRALLALKFAGEIALAAPLGRALARAHRRTLGPRLGNAPAPDRPLVFAPVPLAPQRLVRRGFNQSAEIARAAARLAGARFDAALLARTRETPAQSLLALEHRRGNLEGAFVATRRIDGGAVVVIDDVMTSGATLHACALALKAAGARVVHNLVVARTP